MDKLVTMSMSHYRALAIIPARGGSKRLPRKNVLPLGGKPLIAYSIEAAIKSGCFQTVILSSDDDEILRVGAMYGAIPQKRPQELASDRAKVVELMRYYVQQENLAEQYDIIALLLPTCPFRRSSDIRSGFALLSPEVDTVISVTDYEFSPQLNVVMDDDGLLTMSEALLSGNTRSQDLRPLYHPNGAFYISWWLSFQKRQSFFQGRVRGYVMSRLYSTDIDEAIDLQYAQFLVENGLVQLED